MAKLDGETLDAHQAILRAMTDLGVVPARGNLGVGVQQFWLGTHRAGQTVTLRIDTTTVHLGIDGTHLKTLSSRMTTSHLARLRVTGARPAGPAPARPAAAQLLSGPVEIHRTVNASGNVSVAGHYVNVGAQHAGRRGLGLPGQHSPT